jgi:hypothetical protein
MAGTVATDRTDRLVAEVVSSSSATSPTTFRHLPLVCR